MRALALILVLLVTVVCELKCINDHTCHCNEMDVTPCPCKALDKLLQPYKSNSSMNISLCHPKPCGAVKESLVCVEINGTEKSYGNGNVTYSLPTNDSIEFCISQSGVQTRITLNCGVNQTHGITYTVSFDSVSLNMTINLAEACSSCFKSTSTTHSTSLPISSFLPPMVITFLVDSSAPAPTVTMSSPPTSLLSSPILSPSPQLSSAAVSFSTFASSHVFPSSPPPMPSSLPHSFIPSPSTLPSSSSFPVTSPPHSSPSSHSSSSSPSPPPPIPPSSSFLPLSTSYSFSSSSTSPLSTSFTSPSPSPNCPTQPKHCPSCDECMRNLYITVGTTIPGTILVTALAMLPLIWCFQKAKKRGTYIRMAPTVYFDEDDKD